MIGRQSKHHPGVAGAQWRKRAQKTLKVFRPNLHWARIAVNGTRKRVRLCTKCLRLAKRAMSESSARATKQVPTQASV